MPDLPPLLGEVAKPQGFDGEVQLPAETSQVLRTSSPNRGAKKLAAPFLPPLLGEVAKPLGFDGEV